MWYGEEAPLCRGFFYRRNVHDVAQVIISVMSLEYSIEIGSNGNKEEEEK